MSNVRTVSNEDVARFPHLRLGDVITVEEEAKLREGKVEPVVKVKAEKSTRKKK